MNRLKANPDRSASKTSAFLMIFGIVWCAFVAAFDWTILRSTFFQAQSTWYKPTPARILQSESTSRSDSEGGVTHGVKFEYTYTVDGTTYTSTRHTFDGSGSSDKAWVHEAVAAFPAGSERTCFYDPRDPGRAVLAPGLHGSDITHLMFLTPFNIVGGFLIAYPIWSWRERRRPALIAPRINDRLHNREAYSLNNFNPLVTFFAVFLFTSFVGIFAVVFTGGFHPTMFKVLCVWGTGFAIALAAAIHVHSKTKSGRYDLVFDQNSRTITIPAVQKHTREIIPIAEVKQFDVETVETGSGDDHKITWQVKLRANADREFLLQETCHEPHAHRLANTLNAKLNS